ncbi:MAG: hypothetical protein FJY54_05990 [Betaproteobacteria bacterium]|nr:hypothetical protein [Betaproteobacteria bacterium]
MSLAERLRSTSGTVLLYGTTPPREGAPEDTVHFAAGKLEERIRGLPLDGIVVYDLQDESVRTSVPRPFPFSRTIDPRAYSTLLATLTGKSAVCYKCIGQMDVAGWDDWLTRTSADFGLRLISIVGRPSSRGAAHAMSLTRAFDVAAAHPARFQLGAVAIAERHSGADESRRMLEKIAHGCAFFVSQAVYDPEPTIRLLTNYLRGCRESGIAPRRVVLTFSPCGRDKTMAFIKWLGISVPVETERAILSASRPVAKSIEICRENLLRILDQDDAGALPLGLNIESVSINREEIDASVDLFHALAEVLRRAR